jgi:hypothetical protein
MVKHFFGTLSRSQAIVGVAVVVMSSPSTAEELKREPALLPACRGGASVVAVCNEVTEQPASQLTQHFAPWIDASLGQEHQVSAVSLSQEAGLTQGLSTPAPVSVKKIAHQPAALAKVSCDPNCPTQATLLLDPEFSENAEDQPNDPLAQIIPVTDLSDVQPTDWAYQALVNLIERYGVIAGYPDNTFRGNRALTRYEFAAALNAVSERLNELVVSFESTATQEDLATLERLRADFASELASVQSRADNLGERLSELEANQFSTTTKLNGTITFNVAAAGADGDIRVERVDPTDVFSDARRGSDGKPIVTTVRQNPQATFSQLVALILTSSFTSKDLLTLVVVAGNGDAPSTYYSSAGLYNSFGVSGLNFTPSADKNDVVLAEALYTFPLSQSVQVTVGPKFLWARYFDVNAFTSLFGRGASGFNTFGSTLVNDLGRGSGGVVQWRITPQLDFRAGYFANPDAANTDTGLFDGGWALTTQLTYSPTPNINLRLLYDRSRMVPDEGQIRTKPIIGVADDGFGGALDDATADLFSFNADWLITPRLGLFGRYTYANTHLDAVTDAVEDGRIKAQSLQVGVAFPDLGKRGALATLSYTLPFSILEGRQFLVAGGGDGGVQYEFEATYYLPLTDNIALIPSFYIIGNPNNFDDNPTVYSGTVRTQFNF